MSPPPGLPPSPSSSSGVLPQQLHGPIVDLHVPVPVVPLELGRDAVDLLLVHQAHLLDLEQYELGNADLPVPVLVDVLQRLPRELPVQLRVALAVLRRPHVRPDELGQCVEGEGGAHHHPQAGEDLPRRRVRVQVAVPHRGQRDH
eukprot:CAMPEP_0194571640 /NCGR_PEP_ID=MMETSP0292-20121207/8550_1 /TAXON_ID=39354 /ORGANISM="Heterosigma akashiwo, Strain CCMP2393" /LENGTH=144 /DNA_ID=CAMNT_0039422481 /DNA_START=569 /DNA_END=1004 /DNA_ORIENTATION=-